MSELVVLVTGPDPETLRTLGRTLIEERHCACANVIPGVVSIYRWEGAVEEDAEALAILKTTEARVEALTARVAELHPYDLPEIVAVPVVAGSQEYLSWVRDSVG